MSTDAQRVASRLRIALDLFAAGEAMMRQKLRRDSPDAADSEIETQLQQWLAHRPGAEHGDAAGHAVPWPRIPE